jgi:protocatechuate 3,4-dioxygenase beta subunit
MKSLLSFAQIALVALLVSCGGGGGNPGTASGTTASASTTSTGTVSSQSGDTQTTALGSVKVELLSGAGLSTQSISAVEVAAVKVTVKDSKGSPVSGTIVTFGESGVGLLKFSPESKTALTTSEGIATLEVRAADQTKTGATSISVGASVAQSTISAVKILEITNAPITPGVTIDPQTLATAINFVSTDPADKAIVLKGAGGNGRTETGILNFRVVDKNGTPVKGVTVDFVVNPANDVVLNIAQSKSDGDGIVSTSVSSKLIPTSVVVKATVTGKTITTQSDQLKVTTGLGVQVGFEILPLIYNLDGGLSGDSTPITARLVDSNSNPVADGVPVVMVATGGKIGTSSAGGCNTSNGVCTVTFEVQNPRPANGIVDINGSAKVGESTTLLSQIKVHMSSAPLGIFELAPGIPAAPLVTPGAITVSNCGKFGRTYMVANALGYSTPAGTTVAVEADTATGVGVTIKGGNTVLDVGNFGPSAFDVVIDPSSATTPPCSDTGIDFSTSVTKFEATAPKSKRVSPKTSLFVRYPSGELKLVKYLTADQPVAINVAACDFETTRIDAIGTFGLSLPANSTFAVSASEASAIVDVSTVAPNVADPGASTNVSAGLSVPSSVLSRQSIWIRVKAPTAGVNPCAAIGKIVPATFTVDVTVTTPNQLRNTKTITVTYPKN